VRLLESSNDPLLTILGLGLLCLRLQFFEPCCSSPPPRTPLHRISYPIVFVCEHRTLKSVSRLGLTCLHGTVETLVTVETAATTVDARTRRVAGAAHSRSFAVELYVNCTTNSVVTEPIDTDRSATYDFPLVIHSNHGPISYCF